MNILEQRLTILFLGSKTELSQMGGINRAFPKPRTWPWQAGLFDEADLANTKESHAILVLDNGSSEIIESLKSLVIKYGDDLESILISMSDLSESYDLNEFSFYSRWRHVNLGTSFSVSSSSDSEIERDVMNEEPLRNRLIFVEFSKNIMNNQDNVERTVSISRFYSFFRNAFQ